MAELDKKILKTQTDLVQSVLEAHEKKNSDRVDMLITNAIKQLKMSRFKPDQTTCISLAYLARISPKIFTQSNTIKETLKSLLRRDNGPTNIKGKCDIILPVLAANILLAACDSSDIRSVILNKVDQWLGTSQKSLDIVQNLIATICMKCQSDPQTISTLTDIRQHWLHFMKENYDIYGSVPDDLCASIRRLLHTETDGEKLITYLDFLMKHDKNIDGLSREVGQFINKRPMTLNNFFQQEQIGMQLTKMLLEIFVQLFEYLKSKPQLSSGVNVNIGELVNQEHKPQSAPTSVIQYTNKTQQQDQNIKPKLESNETIDVKTVKTETIEIQTAKPKVNVVGPKKDDSAPTSDHPKSESDTPVIRKYIPPLYLKIPKLKDIPSLDKNTLEAVLSLLAVTSEKQYCREEYDKLLRSWLVTSVGKENQMTTIFEDYALTKVYDLPDYLRLKLALSNDQFLTDLSLENANTAQLVKLLLQCGTTIETVDKVLKRLDSIQDLDTIRAELHDDMYFCAVVYYYIEQGSSKARDFIRKFDQSLDESVLS